ncbi:MAG: hypothetical protein KKE02_06530 [Alphaproteobacteria bacterium]|nr:hypothetical protein [Alphaproteobacteria bacterium]MBU1513076.1 hypothetical protein [Alphaproteobacteria bacterium]MBU2095184.1 hypothetical protein [Alphaproteobacteria bacterium]MBU2150657.1 hypothetical protein [Alphaproteobacteria bacterium]MBU2306084.1 hypothetical protein [Alphaproteobacteria bacterium]
MSGSHQHALVEARKLVRTLVSAPDPRRRAQEVLSVLKRVEEWPPAAREKIMAADAWLRATPSLATIEPQLRALLTQLG